MKALFLICVLTITGWGSPPGVVLTPRPDQKVTVAVSDPANRTWRVEGSTDGSSWWDLGEAKVRNTGLEIAINLRPPVERRFFRLRESQGGEMSSAVVLRPLQSPHSFAERAVVPRHLGRNVSRVTINDRAAALGRVLFYDRRLSANQAVSCATCHQQRHAFADPERFSRGHFGVRTLRNSHTLMGVRTYGGRSTGIFMDGRATDLREAIAGVIEHPEEMGSDLEAVVQELGAEPYYRELWSAAHGTSVMTSAGLVDALAQFVECLPAFDSRYDRFLAGTGELTPAESRGRRVFQLNCAGCHVEPTTAGTTFLNNGLDLETGDPGRGAVTGAEEDMGTFRPPTLRNIAVTAPYMHDGRFATLRETLEFYDRGIQNHPNLSILPAGGIGFRDGEIEDLEAFLNALTDEDALVDEALSDPFVKDVVLSE